MSTFLSAILASINRQVIDRQWTREPSETTEKVPKLRQGMYKYTGGRWRSMGNNILRRRLAEGGERHGRRESAAEHGCELALYPWR